MARLADDVIGMAGTIPETAVLGNMPESTPRAIYYRA